MSMIGKPCIGMVYKKANGTTYTDWYHQEANTWYTPEEVWVKDRLFFAKISRYNWPRLMAIVRSK